VLKHPRKRTDADTQILTYLIAAHTTLAVAIPLAQDFAEIVRARQADRFDSWLDRATTSGVAPLRRFARGLRGDYAAVKAGLTLPWSNEHVAYCTSLLASGLFEVMNPLAATARWNGLWGDEQTSPAIIIARSRNPATVIPVPHRLCTHAQTRRDLLRRLHAHFP
jgi:hypothetical protein